jgi:hypothetical protein
MEDNIWSKKCWSGCIREDKMKTEIEIDRKKPRCNDRERTGRRPADGQRGLTIGNRKASRQRRQETDTYIYTHIHTAIHTHTHTHTHIYIHNTHMHTNIHIRIHTNTYIHTHTREYCNRQHIFFILKSFCKSNGVSTNYTSMKRQEYTLSV